MGSSTFLLFGYLDGRPPPAADYDEATLISYKTIGEIHVYFLLQCCWRLRLPKMVGLFARQKSTSIQAMQTQLPWFHLHVVHLHWILHQSCLLSWWCLCYHWDAIRSVLKLVVKILKVIIKGCEGWCIDLNDWKTILRFSNRETNLLFVLGIRG